MKLQGNTILIAGGASGIGRGMAELLCRLGNEVIIFGAGCGVGGAAVRPDCGLRTVELDLSDPWSVSSFAEQVGITHRRLNMLINVSIAFPVKYLPGLRVLLEDDGTLQALEAHRLGLQHLTGTLLEHLRKQPHSAVVNVSAGPVLAPPMAPSMAMAMEGGVQASVMSVRKRWATAAIEVIDINRPSRAERVNTQDTSSPGMSMTAFLSRVANLLAEGLHEEAAVGRLRALWPVVEPAAHESRDDDRIPEVA